MATVSPNPLPLVCALLLCLPLALVFTTAPLNTNITTLTVAINQYDPPRQIIFNSSSFSNSSNNNIIRQRQRRRRDLSDQPFLFPSPSAKEVEELKKEEEKDDDKLLLRRASLVNPNVYASPKKIAFLFLTTSPLPFAPLWELFFKGGNNNNHNYYNIYVHADPTYNYSHPPFTGVFSGRVIPSKPTRRHSPTLVSAARRLLAHALLHDSLNHIFVLLSASCVPLHSFRYTYRKLAVSPPLTTTTTTTNNNNSTSATTTGAISFIEILKNETGAFDRWAARGEHAMLPEVGLDDFRIGSQFWALTRAHALAVVRDRRMWSKFRLPCVRWDTCYPEENYFPTLVASAPADDPAVIVVPATLTHVDWNGSFDGHPKTYNATELNPGLIRRLRRDRPRYGDWGIIKSKRRTTDDPRRFLFARKFAPDCLGPLLELSTRHIFND